MIKESSAFFVGKWHMTILCDKLCQNINITKTEQGNQADAFVMFQPFTFKSGHSQ